MPEVLKPDSQTSQIKDWPQAPSPDYSRAEFIAPTPDSHSSALVAPSPDNRAQKITGALILAAAVILLAAWGIYKYHQNGGSGIPETADDIRKLFTPATTTPEHVSPLANSDSGQPMIDPEAASVPILSRGPEQPAPTRVLGANTNPPAQTPPPPPPALVFQTYQNSSLGFKMRLNQDWQATASGDGQSVAFVSRTGQSMSVQAFNNPGSDIAGVQQQLAGSPSVSNLSSTTFLGEPALEFKTQTGWGVAVIHNNRLYYIMAPSLRQEPANSFMFL